MSISLDKCILCSEDTQARDSGAALSLSLPEDRTIAKCQRCGLRWLRPMLSEEECEEFYKTYFNRAPEDYDQVVLDRLPCYRERIDRLKKILGNAAFSILDVGAGTGEFVFEAQKSGLQAEGLELSSDACQKAFQKYGVRLIRGDLAGLPEGLSFDVIHMHHVFEHFVHPFEMLTRVDQHLKPGGYFVIEVPYQFDNWLDFIVMPILNKKVANLYSVYSIHHPFFYSPKAIKKLLAQRFNVSSLITRTYIQNPSFLTRTLVFIGDRVLKWGYNIEAIARKPKRAEDLISSVGY